MGREGGEEGGLAFFEDFGASGALAGEGSVLVEDGEVEERGKEVISRKEAISRLDRGRSYVRSDFFERENTEATEAGVEGDDLGVGVEGARGGAEDEERVLKLSIDLFPAARQARSEKLGDLGPLSRA
jgi:hypothetical protein